MRRRIKALVLLAPLGCMSLAASSGLLPGMGAAACCGSPACCRQEACPMKAAGPRMPSTGPVGTGSKRRSSFHRRFPEGLMQFRHLFVGILTILLAPGLARATIFGDVRGVVHDPQHRPIESAQVSIHNRASTWSKTTLTDA